MRFTEDELKAFGYERQSDGVWRRRKVSVRRDDSREVPKLESGAQQQAQGSYAVEEKHDRGRSRSDSASAERRSDARRLGIFITASCRRHTDPDNLCPKWFIDRLREFGIIPDDSSAYIAEVVKRVEKIPSWAVEQTTIELWEL